MAGYTPVVRSYRCVVCGADFVLAGRGAPPKYCSPHCRYTANAERNGPLLKASVLAWQQVNGRSYQRDYRQKDPESARARDRLDYQRHPDAHRERRRAYRAAYPAKARQHARNYQHRRRARMVEAGAFRVTLRDWRRLVQRYRGCCAYCGDRPRRLEADHIMPIARGGRHCIGNILPACKVCNQAKGSRYLVEWRYSSSTRGDGRSVHRNVLPAVEGAVGRPDDQLAALAAGDPGGTLRTSA